MELCNLAFVGVSLLIKVGMAVAMTLTFNVWVIHTTVFHNSISDVGYSSDISKLLHGQSRSYFWFIF